MCIALHQPDIAGNVGAVARLAACMGVPLDIVMPCGFAFSDRAFRRSAMDYVDRLTLARWPDFDAFRADVAAGGGRLVLLTTDGDTPLHAMRFRPGDALLMGSESAGVPPAVHAAAAARVRIPMAAGARSLNLGVSAGIALAEALRQTELFPA